MNRKPVVPRALAHRDVEGAIDYYIQEGGLEVAGRFIDGLEAVYRQIGEHPASGSPRYAHELALPGLRCLSLNSFPWLVFYLARDDHIDVWRVLHASRDIPTWLQDRES